MVTAQLSMPTQSQELAVAPSVTPIAEADAIAQRLASRKHAWANVSIGDRIAYLEQCIESVLAVAEPWADAACRAKGIDPASTLAGEEWYAGPAVTLFNLRLLITALKSDGHPQPVKLRNRQGQAIAQVFPASLMDHLLLLGFKGEVWIEPGQPASQGQIYREPSRGKVALVLGAGNVSSIAPMDALNQLFAEDQVVLLKMNPVNEYMGPILEAAFAPLRRDGFFEVAYGGAELGSYLCQHPLVDTIHITGSHHTHDAIVWGSTAAEQAERKARKQPLNSKPISSELGCVTPVVIVPGHWSQADLKFQARHVAEMVAHNASFNCCSGKLLVTSSTWPQRDEFLALVRQELAATPLRLAYYPGAQQRYQGFLDRYPQADPVADPGAESQVPIIPWTLIPSVPAQAEEHALTQEAFCGVLAEVSLEATDAGDFLQRATDFVNQTVWGSLSCTVLVDPTTQRQWAVELEQAIAHLRYGAIGINVWSAVVFSMPMFPWGAFPGNPLDNVGSGRGMVHNTYLFDHPQKSVLRGPFRTFPTPIWFSRNKNLHQLTQRFAHLQANPSWGNLLKVVLAAVKG